jgi:cytochrome P450
MAAQPALPPGPRLPRALQTMGWWNRPLGFLERCRARYGSRFTIRLLVTPPMVMVSDPEEIKAVFTAPPDVLHPGEGARILEPVVGPRSVILLDEGRHLEQRKLMLPAFHGERMARLEGVMTEVAEREVAAWPRGEPFALHPRLQAVTLEIILRAVFGLDEGARLDALRAKLTDILAFGASPLTMLPPLQRDLGGLSPWARFSKLRDEVDALIFALVEERRAERAGRDDVLAMLLDARHEDQGGSREEGRMSDLGSPMSHEELRDELMTLLVAGHETTASELAWTFERLFREPRVMRRLTAEIDGGDGDAYVTATVQEALRRRPVLPNAAPRLVKKPVQIGPWTYPEGVCVSANAYLVHHDAAIYPDPYAFRPERFLDEGPGTYTWIPFGGGRRRCLGASFATLEMKLILRAVLSRAEVEAAGGAEVTRRRSITVSPGEGARAVVRDRAVAEPAPPASGVPAAA